MTKARVAVAASAAFAMLAVPAGVALASPTGNSVKPAVKTASVSPNQLISICLTIEPGAPFCIVL